MTGINYFAKKLKNSMRYREDQLPDSQYPYTKQTHDALAVSMVLAIAIGIALLWLGIHGRILWLKVWSVGLILLSIVYLLNDWLKIV